MAVAVERLSNHPLARAVVRDGSDRLTGVDIPEAHSLKETPGTGLCATVGEHTVSVGTPESIQETEPLPTELETGIADLEQRGRTIVLVKRGDRFLGVLGFLDQVRETARDVIGRLRQLGIERIVMISGDRQRVAEAIGGDLGLDEIRGGLLPEDKVQAVSELRQRGEVAMVGDGVNDAPAMAQSSVEIAMGAAGSDVALETAEVALMADRLDKLPFAIGLGRFTNRIIRQNLWLSLGMIAVLVPATVFGLRIGPAVALHEGSTVLVVFNALRLLAWRER